MQGKTLENSSRRSIRGNTRLIVPFILKELSKVSIPDDKIAIVVVTGVHRSNTEAEMESIARALLVFQPLLPLFQNF
ncbi:MAG: lactate racemase domain-containing protein [Candidatus Bathyarchaeia archaeon]